MDEWQTTQISRKAKEIRSEIIGGAIYGVPVTGDDLDVMLVAAYHYGRSREMRESSPRLYELFFTETESQH